MMTTNSLQTLSLSRTVRQLNTKQTSSLSIFLQNSTLPTHPTGDDQKMVKNALAEYTRNTNAICSTTMVTYPSVR